MKRVDDQRVIKIYWNNGELLGSFTPDEAKGLQELLRRRLLRQEADSKKEWLREQLSDLVKDILEIERSNLPLFNKGLEVKCAIDTKLQKLLEQRTDEK